MPQPHPESPRPRLKNTQEPHSQTRDSPAARLTPVCNRLPGRIMRCTVTETHNLGMGLNLDMHLPTRISFPGIGLWRHDEVTRTVGCLVSRTQNISCGSCFWPALFMRRSLTPASRHVVRWVKPPGQKRCPGSTYCFMLRKSPGSGANRYVHSCWPGPPANRRARWQSSPLQSPRKP